MRSRYLRCRPSSGRLLVFTVLLLAFAGYCYYYNSAQTNYKKNGPTRKLEPVMMDEVSKGMPHIMPESLRAQNAVCTPLHQSTADIDTVQTFPQFEFQSWIRARDFWDKTFEERYEILRKDKTRPKLKVIVVPHSHNDPGWLHTFEQYFELKTKKIINNIVQKLTEYPNMTFIWSEISFLSAWWESAHPIKQRALKKLIKQGRLEITTGGWVMPDEACTHLYALVDQFIEGHQWVKNNLGVKPKNGWSVDPFGHGPTVPYLLDKSDLKGTIIQRIHYSWKQWFAKNQIEDFHWVPAWQTDVPTLLVHNQPFDIYSIKSSCGPHPSVCLSFDFRYIQGEYTEYSAKHEDINERNIHKKALTLVSEYARTGSLTKHNVALIPLGDDFRYEHSSEFDAQYKNYLMLFNYINKNPEVFNAEVSFGTPKDYFEAVLKRQQAMPTLKGDFFVYSDIFSDGQPAYWSGYYTTRPYIKILSRQFEHHLRTAEILYALVLNKLRQENNQQLAASAKRLEKYYEQLIIARRNLGLFQHHDGITGTSRENVMFDYGTKLITSLYDCMRLQELALSIVLMPDEKLHSQNLLQSESEWETYGKQVKRLEVSTVSRNIIVVFNPLIESKTEVIVIRSNTSNVRIYDVHRGEDAPYQVGPVLEANEHGDRIISASSFNIFILAKVPALTTIKYSILPTTDTKHLSTVFCNCNVTQVSKSSVFKLKKMMPGDIQLENNALKLLINRNSGFLRQIYRKNINQKSVIDVQFGAYNSAQRQSGAYLFKPDQDVQEKSVLNQYSSNNDNLLIVSGTVVTEITTSKYVPFLMHTLRIFNVDDEVLSQAVYIENTVNFENPPKNRETELFMRVQTDIQNGDPPEFYTDQNGFQYQKRVHVSKLGIEGNYFPITTMAWIQDDQTRFTLVTDHAQGAAASEPGRLEVMLDRRTLYDDFRGVGEGVVDNKETVFKNWLVLESVSKHQERHNVEERHFNDEVLKNNIYQVPSYAADRLSRNLNYPANVYLVDTGEVSNVEVVESYKFASNLPEGLHMVSLRTMTDEILEQSPTSSCLMILHRPPRSCSVGQGNATAVTPPYGFTEASTFTSLRLHNVTIMSLTGIRRKATLTGLHDISLREMDLKTYQITF